MKFGTEEQIAGSVLRANGKEVSKGGDFVLRCSYIAQTARDIDKISNMKFRNLHTSNLKVPNHLFKILGQSCLSFLWVKLRTSNLLRRLATASSCRLMTNYPQRERSHIVPF